MAAELLLVQSQLEKARQDLRHVEEGIRKTSVRDPAFGFGDRLGGRGGRRGGGMVRPQMRERQFQREESPPKHKISSVASRLGPVNVLKEPVKKNEEEDEEEEEETPTLRSTVIQSVGVTELTRETAVPVDKATVQRSRRLFGSLLMGTLKQFKQDKVKTKEQEEKQAVVLEKIQKKEVEQKVQSAAERKKLFQCKDGVKDEIKLLEEQMNLTEMKVLCEAERDKLVQFIQTKTGPPLFYLPKEHNKKTEAALKESTARVTESYAARVSEFDSKLSSLKTRIEEVQQTKDATLTTPLKKETDPLQSKDNGQEDLKAPNKETGIKIEVQLRSKEENGHSEKKRRHSSASEKHLKEEKKEKKRRHSTESEASMKSAKEEKKDKKSKRRHSTASAKSEKEEVVTKSSSESESSSGQSSDEDEKSPVKKSSSKKSPKKESKSKTESKKSPAKESKSPRKKARRSSKGKEE